MFGNIAKRLSGKTVLITGASAGIGKATAQAFTEAANGDIKLVLAARRLEKLNALQAELTSQYPKLKVHPVILDVSKIETIEPFLKALPTEFATIDVLVNNAGKALGLDPIGTIDSQDVDTMFQTNVLGLIQLTQLVVTQMKKRNRGDIIQLGSVAGRNPYPGGGIYCATKAALRSFTHVLREELINTKIRVIEIQPGNVESDEFSLTRFKGDKNRAAKVYEGTEPLTQEDIAELIVFAASRRENTVIAESLIFSTDQASAYHIYRA
ncbi:DEKNAAC104766 [Brettanomyces naardenensis]|uniref:DEKNAAC104766 n=1 Tax=Brettanomyces naardenensis TaxID=13370 RepID=A0A448YRS5_BRENA|nr:DEKNAAC104766 [Brettanomyces naardenensis]